MRFLLRLPPSATLLQRLTYPFARHFFWFFFTYLPYAPIRRVNKPDLNGPYLWAGTHSNFMCDCVPAGYEGPVPTKFLGKSTLFKFPTKWFVEYCNALPVARAEDGGGDKMSRAAQNRATFKAAIAAMKGGWPVAIFPEGVSLERPGLVLPLKPGVAKLALAAEEAADFKLGLRIIPVGLEYGSRTRVGSGLYIRYGKPLLLKDYEARYQQDSDRAVKDIMDDLTRELIGAFPHFTDQSKARLGKELVALGLLRNKFEAAQLFLRKQGDNAFWDGLEAHRRAFEEASQELGIPVPAWGYRQAWRSLGPQRRLARLAWIVAGFPIFLIDLPNNSMPEYFLSSAAEFLSTDETETMSFRFMLSPVVLGLAYAFQFWFLKSYVFEAELRDAGFGTYVAYTAGSFVVWYLAVHWRRQFKRLASLFFFGVAGVRGDSDCVKKYRELRDYLGKF